MEENDIFTKGEIEVLIAMAIGLFFTFVIIVIFGKNALFRGTPLESLHDYINGYRPSYLINDLKSLFDEKQFLVVVEKYKMSPNYARGFAAGYGIFCLYYFYGPWNRVSESSEYIVLAYKTVLEYIGLRDFLGLIGKEKLVGALVKYGSIVLIAVNIITFAMSAKMDPGYVTKENVQEKCSMFTYDGIYYHKNICKSCKLLRPPRSKHCNSCKRCVSLYDHHCILTNSCVSYKNYKIFIAFLGSFLTLCTLGTMVLSCLLYNDYKNRGVYLKKVYDKSSGTYRHLSHMELYFALLRIDKFICVTIQLLLFAIPSVFFYIAYQIYLVGICMTANEVYKHRVLDRLLKQNRLWISKRLLSNPFLEDNKDFPFFLDQNDGEKDENHYYGENKNVLKATAGQSVDTSLWVKAEKGYIRYIYGGSYYDCLKLLL